MFFHRVSNINQSQQKLIDSIGDGIFVTDEKGNIVSANIASEGLLGRSKAEMIGQNAVTMLGALDADGHKINKITAALAQAIRRGKKTTNATRQFARKDGVVFWSTITVTPLDPNKKNHGAIVIFRDVTSEKRETEYHTDFARVASHQLRTPLSNVVWSMEYLLSEDLGKLQKKQKEFLKDAYKTLKEMNTLVNDLLSLARLQSSKIKTKKALTSVPETVNQIVGNLSYYAKALNVQFDIQIPKRGKYDVIVAKEHLQTILQNLIENAVRYAKPKSAIVVRIVSRDGRIIISVQNQGIGIPKDQQKYIFAKFFRAKNAIEHKGDGTGLGLYITHGLVSLYKGEIWFESVPKKTTTFFVKLKKA